MKFKTGVLFLSLLLMLAGCRGWCGEPIQNPPPPDWARNLIIYEIATKGFTSPNGPESGTFKSLQEQVPYLADLGVTGVWLTGWNLANDHHFFGIWTQYATIDPSKLDPSLGTEQDFKDIIAELHKYGIKIFLDSTEHGVMNGCPLIKDHPNWFNGGSWGMTDYDWKGKNGSHPDLDKWWMDYWMRWITEFGVDGARLDVALGKPSLWAEIKRKAAEAGHPIVVFCEAGCDPVSDFTQRAILIPERRDAPIQLDIAKTFGSPAHGEMIQSMQLSCHDHSNAYVAQGSPFFFGYFLLAPANFLFMGGEEFDAEFKPLPRLTPDLYGKEPPGPKSGWLYGSWLQWDQLKEKRHADMLAAVKRLICIRKQQGDLIRAGGRGIVTNIANVDVQPGGEASAQPAAKFARPYVLWNERHAVVVGGHSDAKNARSFTWNVPVEKFGWKTGSYKVSDLWGKREERIVSAEALAKMDITIGPDRTPDGGLAVLEIRPVESK